MILKTTEEKIMAKVIRRGRGTVFFGTEFLSVGHPDAVRQALSRLARAGTIRRIGTALYHYPAINDKLGGELPPSADAVARAKAIASLSTSKVCSIPEILRAAGSVNVPYPQPNSARLRTEPLMAMRSRTRSTLKRLSHNAASGMPLSRTFIRD